MRVPNLKFRSARGWQHQAVRHPSQTNPQKVSEYLVHLPDALRRTIVISQVTLLPDTASILIGDYS